VREYLVLASAPQVIKLSAAIIPALTAITVNTTSYFIIDKLDVGYRDKNFLKPSVGGSR
jgi:hypothetical protein